MTEARICPVCKGRQKVPETFYFGTDNSGTGEMQCKSCGGTGYILIGQVYPYV